MGIDFKELLKPYKKGGTQSNPVKRSLSTICNALIYKHRIPSDIVGAAVLEVFMEMAERGLEFKGDDSYGSPGRELFQEIRRRCIRIATDRNVSEVLNSVIKESSCLRMYCPKRTTDMVKLTRWNRFVRFMLKPRGLWRI